LKVPFLAHVAHQVEVLFHDGLEAGAEAQVKRLRE